MTTVYEAMVLLFVVEVGVLIFVLCFEFLENYFSRRPGPIIHRHPLEATEENSEYKCSECLQLGLGKRLKCHECREYSTHPDCARPPTTVRHPFLSGCNFKFCSSGGKNDVCEACGKNTTGCFYLCRHCNKVLHLYCAKLKLKLTTDDKKQLRLMDGISSKCSKCRLGSKERGRTTWGYVSKDGDCQLHIYCVMKLVAEKMSSGGCKELIRKFTKGTRRLIGLKLWITMAAAIASALLGDPIALVGLVQYILKS